MKNLVVNAGKFVIHHRQDNAAKFESKIPVHYKENAKWLFKVETELEVVKTQNNVVITKEDVLKCLFKMPN